MSVCNENIVKNISTEVTRVCQAQGCTVDPNFVAYVIDLMFLNPKYGKLFEKSLNRNKLEFFVNVLVSMISQNSTSITTLKMQHTIQTNYASLPELVQKYSDSIDSSVQPLVSEILGAEVDQDDEEDLKKLNRKISVLIILASGLGSPAHIVTLKEGISALESVFSVDDVKKFVTHTKSEKKARLDYLIGIVSGIRLFNQDCKKGGETISDIPVNLVEAGQSCKLLITNKLHFLMETVNILTSGIEKTITIDDETGNLCIDSSLFPEFSRSDMLDIFELVALTRQYELLLRKLIADTEEVLLVSRKTVLKFKNHLGEIHAVVKNRTAVPVDTVFPLFSLLWGDWREMQHQTYLVSTIHQMTNTLAALQEAISTPGHLTVVISSRRSVQADREKLLSTISLTERLSLMSLRNFEVTSEFVLSRRERNVQYLGFCALCLTIGALVPSNLKIGVIKHMSKSYAFCSVAMAKQFAKDPQRYLNELLEFSRNNIHFINLLNNSEDVFQVKDIQNLTVIHAAISKVCDKDVQTDVHPQESYIEKDYSWNMWKWKRRACQWANIVNCQTHSTQTNHSHLRSEIQCQTAEPRDKSLQTKKDVSVNADLPHLYMWGLSIPYYDRQHYMNLSQPLDMGIRRTVTTPFTCACHCGEMPDDWHASNDEDNRDYPVGVRIQCEDDNVLQ